MFPAGKWVKAFTTTNSMLLIGLIWKGILFVSVKPWVTCITQVFFQGRPLFAGWIVVNHCNLVTENHQFALSTNGQKPENKFHLLHRVIPVIGILDGSESAGTWKRRIALMVSIPILFYTLCGTTVHNPSKCCYC